MIKLFVNLVGVAALCLGMSACMMLPMGPELDKAPSPFGDAALIQLVSDNGSQNITHGPDGDTMILDIGSDKTDTFSRQLYEGQLTYRRIVVDATSEYDFWLMGLNVFRTKDRSYYGILRLPKNVRMVSGTSTEAGLLVLTCAGLEDIKPKPEPGENSGDSWLEDGNPNALSSLAQCDFATLDGVLDAAPKLVAAAMQAEAEATEADAAEAEADEAENEATESEDYLDFTPSDDNSSSLHQWEKVTIVVP